MSTSQKARPLAQKSDPDAVSERKSNPVGGQQGTAYFQNDGGLAQGSARDIDPDQIPDIVQTLEEHRKLCEKEGRYVEAELAKNRISELKEQLDYARKEELRARHMQERMHLEEGHIAEFNQFNEFWDKKMQEFNEQAALVEQELIQRHEQDLQAFLEELEKSLATKPKDSTELLNLRRIQESLAKQKDYIEAHKVQAKCAKMEKDEHDKFLNLRDSKFKNQKNLFIAKQENELKALQKRIATGQEEQRKSRAIELERLLQKYQNAKKELEAQQQLEAIRLSRPGTSGSTMGSLYRSQQASKFGRSVESFKRNQVYESSARKSIPKKN